MISPNAKSLRDRFFPQRWETPPGDGKIYIFPDVFHSVCSRQYIQTCKFPLAVEVRSSGDSCSSRLRRANQPFRIALCSTAAATTTAARNSTTPHPGRPPFPRPCQSTNHTHTHTAMASIRSLCLLSGHPSRSLLRPASAILSSQFSTTSASRYATQPPPTGFRVGRQQTWEDGGSSLDKAAKYFLMSEMARGMYVVLEQFFRAPYTIMYPFEKVRMRIPEGGWGASMCVCLFVRSRARYRRGSAESMR